nr:hypothetical protein [uncultured Methanoregula sp.]
MNPPHKAPSLPAHQVLTCSDHPPVWYPEFQPWICAILAETIYPASALRQGTGCHSSPGSFRILHLNDPPLCTFQVTVPHGTGGPLRECLVERNGIASGTLHDRHFLPACHEREEITFPVILDDPRSLADLGSIAADYGGTVRPLQTHYVIQPHPLRQQERIAFLRALVRDPAIRFIMLEFPEG